MSKISSQWKVESVRCTTFPVPDATSNPETWWNDVTGKLPDQVTTRPSEGIYQAVGSHSNGSLQLVIQPFRIQWWLGPGPSIEGGDAKIVPTIGQTTCIPEFVELVKKWLSKAPPLTRLAFGAVFLDVVDTVESGYKKLAELLPDVNVDSDGMRDFLYQVNRRRLSGAVKGVEINRLSKWSVAAINPVTFQIQDGQPQIQSQVGAPVFAVRLEVDINNVPTAHQVFNEEFAVRMFDELVTLGIEISQSGDVK